MATDLQIKVLVSAGAIAILHGFWCQIRIERAARSLAERLKQDHPDLWAGIQPLARGLNGGQPAVKALYRRTDTDLDPADPAYRRMRNLERRLLFSLALGGACIAILLLGVRFGGWQW